MGKKNFNMLRLTFVMWLGKQIPSNKWEQFWQVASVTPLLILPVGTFVIYLLGQLGWVGAPRAIQGLMFFSVLMGPTLGITILWCIKVTKLTPGIKRRVSILSCLSVVGPLITLILLFKLASLFSN